MKNPRQAMIESANMRGTDRARLAELPDSITHQLTADQAAELLYPDPAADDLRSAFVAGWLASTATQNGAS